MEGHLKKYNMHHGIFIDIFSLDKIKGGNEYKLDFRVNCAKKILALRIIRNGHIEDIRKNKRLIVKVLRPFTLLLPLRFYNNLIDYIYGYQNSKDCKYATNFSSQYGWRKQIFPIDVYGEGTY